VAVATMVPSRVVSRALVMAWSGSGLPQEPWPLASGKDPTVTIWPSHSCSWQMTVLSPCGVDGHTAPPAETARIALLRKGAPRPCGYGGQFPPSVENSTKTRVVTARMPWATTTGTGKFRSGGTLRFLVSDEPG
jgi:hypothetical protein